MILRGYLARILQESLASENTWTNLPRTELSCKSKKILQVKETSDVLNRHFLQKNEQIRSFLQKSSKILNFLQFLQDFCIFLQE